jgi:hypothetical protein
MDQYRDTPLVAVGSDLRFVGRVVIEVFEGTPGFPEGGEIATTWVLAPDRDAGLIFRRVARRLDEMGNQMSGSRPAGAVTSPD